MIYYIKKAFSKNPYFIGVYLVGVGVCIVLGEYFLSSVFFGCILLFPLFYFHMDWYLHRELIKESIKKGCKREKIRPDVLIEKIKNGSWEPSGRFFYLESEKIIKQSTHTPIDKLLRDNRLYYHLFVINGTVYDVGFKVREVNDFLKTFKPLTDIVVTEDGKLWKPQ